MVCYKFNILFWLVALHNHVLVTNKECLSFVLVVDVETEPYVKGWL